MLMACIAGCIAGLVCWSVAGVAQAGVSSLACGDTTLTGQVPVPPDPFAGFSGTGEGTNSVFFDDFSGNRLPIAGLRWWGFELDTDFKPCQRDSTTFEISIWDASGGDPNAVVALSEVEATRVDTGLIYNDKPLFRYEALFDTPVQVTAGFVSVFALGELDCRFFWVESEEGNDAAVGSPAGAANYFPASNDFAWCLILPVQPPLVCPGGSAFAQTPEEPVSGGLGGFLSDDQLGTSFLAENFSGVSEPIVRLRWWGTFDDSGPCAPIFPFNFEIRFYAGDSLGVGTVQSTQVISVNPVDTLQRVAFSSPFFPVFEFNAELVAPVNLSEGWVLIARTGATDGCRFAWFSSPDVDGSIQGNTTFVSNNFDLTLCVSTANACAKSGTHTADVSINNVISLSELLRVIQFFNTGSFNCQAGTEDGFGIGGLDIESCCPHDSDYNAQDWAINLTELLRLIQFFNSGGYSFCPMDGTEDGYCPTGT